MTLTPDILRTQYESPSLEESIFLQAGPDGPNGIEITEGHLEGHTLTVRFRGPNEPEGCQDVLIFTSPEGEEIKQIPAVAASKKPIELTSKLYAKYIEHTKGVSFGGSFKIAPLENVASEFVEG